MSFFSYIRSLFGSKSDEKCKPQYDFEYQICDLIEQSKLPGLALSVIKNGQFYHQKGYGYADLERKIPIDPKKTIFRIASVSKPITALALAKMVEEELIDLEASLYDYVPYFPKKKFDFTIKQLAAHTAGFRGYQGMEYALNKPLSIKQGIDIFKNDDLLFESGTGYNYNSFDFVLLSLAMQEASGIPFESYVYQKVLKPLGLNNTIPEIQGQLPKHSAKFYSKTKLGFREAKEVNNFYKLAGGGYLSTNEEVAKMGKSILHSDFLSNQLKEEFLTAQTINGKSTYYGLGFEVSFDNQGRPFYGHTGNGVGGYSIFRVYPEQDVVIAMLINCTNPKLEEELEEIIDCIFRNSLVNSTA